MNKIDQKLIELGIELPEAAEPMAALLKPARIVADRLLVSAQTPKLNGELIYLGKVGDELDLSTGQEATRLCALNVIAQANKALGGDLARIRAIISVRGYINVNPNFHEIAETLNGASKLLLDIFGNEIGAHARTAIGAASMPFDVAAEVEAEFWIK